MSSPSTAKAHNQSLTGSVEPETTPYRPTAQAMPANPMRQLLVDQVVPQLDMIVKMFDASEDAADPKGQKVRDAAMAFRDALKEWAS